MCPVQKYVRQFGVYDKEMRCGLCWNVFHGNWRSFLFCCCTFEIVMFVRL